MQKSNFTAHAFLLLALGLASFHSFASQQEKSWYDKLPNKCKTGQYLCIPPEVTPWEYFDCQTKSFSTDEETETCCLEAFNAAQTFPNPYTKVCAPYRIVERNNWGDGWGTLGSPHTQYFHAFPDLIRTQYRSSFLKAPVLNLGVCDQSFLTDARFDFRRMRYLTCPDGFFNDNPGQQPSLYCWRELEPPICTGPVIGNPVSVFNRTKVMAEVDYTFPVSGIQFIRYYSSSQPQSGAFGATSHWRHNFERRLQIYSTALDDNTQEVLLYDSSSQIYRLKRSGDLFVGAPNIPYTLHKTSDGYILRSRDSDRVEIYGADGRLEVIRDRGGLQTTLIYEASSAGETGRKLIEIIDPFDKTLRLAYDGENRISAILADDGSEISYAYEEPASLGSNVLPRGQLTSVTHPDGAVKRFHYENAYAQNVAHKNYGLLTGITDEAGNRISHYHYDNYGNIARTQFGPLVHNYSIWSYSPWTVRVSFPNQKAYMFEFSPVHGTPMPTGSNASCPDCGNIPAKIEYNNSGEPVKVIAHDGLVHFSDYDAERRPVQQVRASNAYTDADTLPTEEQPDTQNTQIQWHPTFRLPVKITETGAQDGTRITEYTYDARGNRLSETISGTNLAPVTRRWSYTDKNLVATETDEAGQVTRYGYDQWGNRTSVTDALGRTTTYAYDAAGRVSSQTTPAGITTRYTYDQRGRLLTQTVGNLTTTMSYLPTGLLASVTQPSGHRIDYQYDDAYRLTGWQDNRGNTAQYTLDGMGNRTHERISDAAGNLAFELSRSINDMSRIDRETIGSNQSTRYHYDAKGNLIGHTNALNQHTAYTLDGLLRVSAERNPLNETATRGYNALDALVQASDFKGVTTSYVRDAQGNALQETSADIGAQSTEYDARSLPTSTLDSMGRSRDVARDALGRPTHISAGSPTGSQNLSISYDAHNDVAHIQEPQLNISYQRDALGRTTRQELNIEATP